VNIIRVAAHATYTNSFETIVGSDNMRVTLKLYFIILLLSLITIILR
jgi:hypothetical protein